MLTFRSCFFKKHLYCYKKFSAILCTIFPFSTVFFICFRYRMVFHPSDKNNRVNPYRYTLLVGAAERQKKDGLSNLNYRVLRKNRAPLYTNITVEVGRPPLKPNLSPFGTGIDIVISLSILFVMLTLTCCTCFKSRLIHVLLCPRRIP